MGVFFICHVHDKFSARNVLNLNLKSRTLHQGYGEYIMKKIYLSVIQLVAFVSLSVAQPTNGTVVPDFTVTDINNTSHNLYTYLNSGKAVVVDYFATWCSICWSYHNTANRLKTLYNNHGPSGASGVVANTTNDLMVIKMEIDPNTPTSQITFASQNWTSNTNYPIVDLSATNSVPSAFNATSQSKVFIIYPNKTVENISTSLTDAQIYAKISAVLSINDAFKSNEQLAIKSYFSESGLVLNATTNAKNIDIEIYDLLGKRVFEQTNMDIKQGEQVLNISDQINSNQIYFVKFNGDDFSITQKIAH
jgi:thiol-disulfide isomerase/thioredoxin